MDQEKLAHRHRILIVDDDEWTCDFLRAVLEDEQRDVDVTLTFAGAVERIGHKEYDIILCDVQLHQDTGIELLRRTRGTDDPPEVIMITGYGSIDGAVEAVKEGAFDYLSKPIESNRVLQTVAHALERRSLSLEVKRLRSLMLAAYGDERLVAFSEQMKRVMATVDTVAQTEAPILIEGESGTGKELVARAIHQRSARRDGPFVPVNCAALPESLLESELFGYVKGAFTGAHQEKKGLFESAHGGTILLDEIGELPLALQSALLRVLQDGEIRKVGSTRTLNSNARVIASTNRSLRSMVSDGTFREDLFYRLQIVPIIVPPLRMRPDDILPLTHLFLYDFSRRLNKSFQHVATDAGAFLLQHTWPGNVRELENLIHGIVALWDDETFAYHHIEALMTMRGAHIAPAVSPKRDIPDETPSNHDRLADQQNHAERTVIQETLHQNQGQMAKTAEALGISRSSLWRRLKKHDIRP